jgi:hypothetical protein
VLTIAPERGHKADTGASDMRTVVKKWGNSASVKLSAGPDAQASLQRLRTDQIAKRQSVELEEKQGDGCRGVPRVKPTK